jgi:transposase
MAAERLAMRKTREILRLRFFAGITSSRVIAQAAHCGKTTVNEYLALAKRAGVTSWEQVADLDEQALEQLLNGRPPPISSAKNLPKRNLPDWHAVHEELRNRSVTLALLWSEYRETNPEGYQYSQFAEYYRRWRAKLALVMRQTHRPGEKGFIDFCDGLFLTDRDTGAKIPTELFVGALGASCYTFARATASQELAEWIDVHQKFFNYLGGVPSILVPDNLKSGVKTPDRYEPEINPTYQEMAEHYGTCVIPARVRKPRDKAKAENAVLQAQRWILAVLRHRTFFTLTDMNAAIAECLEKLNTKQMRGYGKSRKELFETLDKPALKRLPEAPYEYAEWKKVRLGLDYHVRFDDHFYSAPYQLYREELWCRATIRTVEIYFKHKRTASHLRSCVRFGKTTVKEHMPSHHREYADWTPERIIRWAATIGPFTAEVVAKMIEQKPHPELAYQSAIGIIRCSEKFGVGRTERASEKALRIGSPAYQTIKTMLKNRMEDLEPAKAQSEEDKQLILLSQENLRGGNYYH